MNLFFLTKVQFFFKLKQMELDAFLLIGASLALIIGLTALHLPRGFRKLEAELKKSEYGFESKKKKDFSLFLCEYFPLKNHLKTLHCCILHLI